MFYSIAQWIGGFGLIFLGLDQLTLHSGLLVAPLLSRYSERYGRSSAVLFLSGLLAGVSLQGRRGLLYLKKRRLAGYISIPRTLILAAGLAVGLLIPAMCMVWGPAGLRFPILAVGLVMSVSLPGSTGPSIGKALLGLGCAWMGFVACQDIPNVSGPAIPAAVIVALLATILLRLPSPIWLTLCALLPTPSDSFWPGWWAAAAVLTGWMVSILRMVRKNPPMLKPAETLLDFDIIPYPERALQAALQELKRMANGLAAIGLNTLPALMKGERNNYRDNQRIEWVLDEFKPTAHHFLTLLTQRELLERQALLALHLSSCVSDLERVGDHVYALAEQMAGTRSRDEVYTEKAHELTRSSLQLIETVAHSITGRQRQSNEAAQAVLQAREACLGHLNAFREELQEHMQTKAITPKTAVLRRSLMSHFERVIRHIRAIAVAENQPNFWIDPDIIHEKADRIVRGTDSKPFETKPLLEQLWGTDTDEESPS